jgi:hypothetical protein
MVIVVITMLSCNPQSRKTGSCQDEGKKDKHSFMDMPANHINDWSDGCGYPFEFSSYSISAFGGTFINYQTLNDRILHVIHPPKPMVIEDVEIESYEKVRYIGFSNNAN